VAAAKKCAHGTASSFVQRSVAPFELLFYGDVAGAGSAIRSRQPEAVEKALRCLKEGGFREIIEGADSDELCRIFNAVERIRQEGLSTPQHRTRSTR